MYGKLCLFVSVGKILLKQREPFLILGGPTREDVNQLWIDTPLRRSVPVFLGGRLADLLAG